MPYKDPEKFRAWHAAYQRAHPEKHAAHQRAYARRNPPTPEDAEKRRVWWAEHAEEISEKRRVLRTGNEDYAAKHVARQRRYKESHPEVLGAYKARRRMRVAVAMSAQDRAESAEWRRLIRTDPCFYCGAVKTRHVDHYVSLANGGTDHWWNLVRACAPCNLRKNSLNGDEFLALLQAGRLDGGELSV